jgi:hypothetical protein
MSAIKEGASFVALPLIIVAAAHISSRLSFLFVHQNSRLLLSTSGAIK